MSESNKKIVEKVNDSFASGSIDGFLEYCADDVVWNMAGERAVKGHDAVREFMKQGEGMETPPQFTVDRMIAEGDSVACWGEMKMKEKGVEVPYSYCDVYTFSGDKITELRSFVVKQKDAAEGKPASA